ncbi:putative enzymatic polyprotein [Sesamum angolense]|uniref:Enzymatic polyprotein n=1 Tax=Sesamum angolense TaxID=2727404 RepID=A0AAE1WB04_9LAMI|nr:putative enzymatic polyprotein [Sesamum angolense]
MRESADFHTNATPTFVETRLRENPGRNPRRAPENTPWARTMLQPLHPYGAVLNLDVIDFRNMEKLIDEWVATIKIAATTLELNKENFIKLVELSLEGSVKIGWDNTPADTKASILAGDSKSAIADRLGRLIKIHFIGDGYFEGSRTEKAREYAQALFSLELRSIYAVDEYIYWFRKYFFQSGVAVDVAAPMFFAKICSPWREMLIQSYKENQVSRGKGGNTGVELKTMDISEESMLSLENVKRLIQRNFSENPLAWWDRNKIETTLKIKEECKYEYVRYKPIQMNMEDKKDMQIIIKEHINLGLIEPGISAYSSPGFLIKMENESKKFTAFSTPQGILIDEAGIELQEHIVEKIRNFPDVLKDKKQLQSFLGVVNFAGIFIKDLAKYKKDFRPLLKETESAKWKWEEIHTQRVRELKQVCNNLPKLAIPQDEDELVVYTDANDYRWAAVLMKKTTTGEEPCRYTGGLFTEQQAQVWHINEKEFFAVWKAFKK